MFWSAHVNFSSGRIDNWQSAMRKQYLRRDPEANPLGLDPPAPSRKESREPTVFSETIPDHEGAMQDDESLTHTPLRNSEDKDDSKAGASSPAPATGDAEQDNKEEKETKGDSIKKEESIIDESITPQDEPKDWFELPLLTRLDSLHLLTEWQFQNPHRLRQFMKDDGDAAQWVCFSIPLLDLPFVFLTCLVAYRTDWVRCQDQCILAHRS